MRVNGLVDDRLVELGPEVQRSLARRIRQERPNQVKIWREKAGKGKQRARARLDWLEEMAPSEERGERQS